MSVPHLKTTEGLLKDFPKVAGFHIADWLTLPEHCHPSHISSRAVTSPAALDTDRKPQAVTDSRSCRQTSDFFTLWMEQTGGLSNHLSSFVFEKKKKKTSTASLPEGYAK